MAARILARDNIRIHKPYAKETLKQVNNFVCNISQSHRFVVLMVCGTCYRNSCMEEVGRNSYSWASTNTYSIRNSMSRTQHFVIKRKFKNPRRCSDEAEEREPLTWIITSAKCFVSLLQPCQ